MSRPEKQIFSRIVEQYPVQCNPAVNIPISRVASFAGVDNALFIVGGGGAIPMRRKGQFDFQSDTINATSGNYPVYAVIKKGADEATHISTDNLQAFLPTVMSFFDVYGDGSQLPNEAELEAVLDTEQTLSRDTVIIPEITSYPSMKDSSCHFTLYTCKQIGDAKFTTQENWVVYPLRTENGETLVGMNLAQWVDNPRSFGNDSLVPFRATGNGVLVVPEPPIEAEARGEYGHTHAPCGLGNAHGNGLVAVDRGYNGNNGWL
jgi:hypothetical protein